MKTIEDYNTLVKTYIDTKDSAKAPTDHSSTATTYGVGSTTKYGHVKVDDALSSTSTNPVQNKKVYELKQALSDEVTTRATLGAHNLYPITLETVKAANLYHSWNGNVATRNGVTYTVNTNSQGYVTSIQVTADAATNTGTTLGLGKIKLPADSYTFSAGGGSSDCFINYRYQINGGSDTLIAYAFGSHEPTATVQDTWEVYGRVDATSGKTINATVYPMIRLASDPSTKFTPYAMTNKELTEAVKCLVLSTGSTTVNALPYTFTNANIENDMVCINSVLSNPSAQTGDWTVTTSSGTAQITGTISGATTITLYLIKSR